MEIGLYTFGELGQIPGGGWTSPAERTRQLVDEMVLADQVGLDVFAIGEHHRPDFVVSAPAVVLAAGAERTSRIRLSSAVSVLSSDDPVRVFQDFATLDLLSGGRAEIMAGRGSFIESFPLFGQDLKDYDELFDEKLRLLIAIRDNEKVTWRGSRHRAPIEGRGVYPRPIQEQLPIWVAVGGTPESAARAGALGLPMALAIIGGMPERFAPFARIFRESAIAAGNEQPPPMSINSHGYVAETSQRAAEEAWPPLEAMMNRIGRERGFSPMTRESFDASRGLRGADVVGSPNEVIDKILFQHSVFQHDRFLLQIIGGGMPHDRVLKSIELFGTQVAPAVRKALAAGATQPTGVTQRAGAPQPAEAPQPADVP
jgi:probable LLM family oxidoreductase